MANPDLGRTTISEPLTAMEIEAANSMDDIRTVHTWKELFTPTNGDITCFFVLFMNNLSTTLASASVAMMVLAGPFTEMYGGPPQRLAEIVYGVIIPGLVPTIVFGCVYYSWMAMRVLRGTSLGTQMTALPYGINTPAALLFIFAIMRPALDESWAKSDKSPAAKIAAVEAGWRAGVIANFIAGVISMLFAFVGPALVQVTPPAGLMIALAGIGFTWLGLNPILDCFGYSMCGIFALVIGLMLQLGVLKTGKLPPAVLLLLVGTLLGWTLHPRSEPWAGGGTGASIREAFSGFGFWMPRFIGPKDFAVVGDVLKTQMGVILPVAFTGAIGTMLNVKAAEQQGDEFPLKESLLIDGLTTCISALFGSPYGTCVYIGHTQYKRMGGLVMYPIMFAALFSVLALTGLCKLIGALVPPYAVQPLLVFIGVGICSESFATSPARHLPGCVIGLFPALADLIVKSGWAPTNGPEGYQYFALRSLADGALMVSMLWTCIMVLMIDCKFLRVALWCFGGAALSAVGMIHQPQVDLQFKEFVSKKWIGTQPWAFVVGYTSAGLLCVALWCCQTYRPEWGVVPPPYEDPSEVTPTAEAEAKRLSRCVENARRNSTFLHNSGSEGKPKAEGEGEVGARGSLNTRGSVGV